MCNIHQVIARFSRVRPNCRTFGMYTYININIQANVDGATNRELASRS